MSSMQLPRWCAPVVLGVTAALGVLALTPDGAGLTNDSVTYVGVATNLSDGHGLTSPFTNTLDPTTPEEAAAMDSRIPLVLWPPGYPVALAAADVAAGSPATGGRMLNALAMAVTAAATSTLARRLAGGNEVAAWLAPLLALASLPVVSLHVFLLSEPLALAVGSTALALLARLLHEHDARALGALALLGALAPLVRVTGLAVPVVAAAALVLFGTGARREQLRRGAIAGVGVLPFLVWMLWARAQTDAAVRPVQWHPPPLVRYEEILARAAEWFVPATAASWWRVGVLLILAVIGCAAVTATVRRRSWQRPPGQVAIVIGAFAFVHTAIVVASSMLLQEQLPLGGRLMVPVLPLLVAVVVAAGVRLASALRARHPVARPMGAAFAIVACVIVMTLALDTRDRLSGAQLGWTLGPHTTFDEEVASLPDDTVIVSNAPARVWLETGRSAIVVPRTALDGAGSPHPRYEQEVAEMRALAACANVAFVLYDDVTFFTPYVASPTLVRELVNLQEVASLGAATLLVPDPTTAETCAGAS